MFGCCFFFTYKISVQKIRRKKFCCDWCRKVAMHIFQVKIPNTKYLKCLNTFVKIGINTIRVKKKVTNF